MTPNVLTLIDRRIEAIAAYAEIGGYESFDPYDGLASPLVRLLPQNELVLRFWQQGIRLSPLNLRPILGIPKLLHTKAVSDFASAYCILYSLSHEAHYREKASKLLNWLVELAVPTDSGMGWGLRFPFATRYVVATEGTYNAFQTINAIHAFLDAYEAFSDSQHLQLALQGYHFLETELGFTDRGNYIVWNYWPGLKEGVWNITGLMLGLTARLHSLTGVTPYRDLAVKLHACITHSQNPDGSWFYSESERGHWVDGYHTGYILEGICRGILAGVIEDMSAIQLGITYYRDHLFSYVGLPKYYSTSNTLPVEIQNSAQAIQTWVFMARLGLCERQKVSSLVTSVDQALWNPKGYYNYMKTRVCTYTTPMHRWSTGPMLLALTQAKHYLERNA
jgi:polysaccharide biosynthesis protein VpsJ